MTRTKQASELVVGENTLSYGKVVETGSDWIRFDSNAVIPIREDLSLTLVDE